MVKTKNNCKDCVMFDKCFVTSWGHDNFPSSIVEYFNAIRQRDLCFYNDKIDFIGNRRKKDRRV